MHLQKGASQVPAKHAALVQRKETETPEPLLLVTQGVQEAEVGIESLELSGWTS